MIKVVLYQDGEIIQEMEGKFAWGTTLINDEETGAFAIGQIDPESLPIRVARADATLLLGTFRAERGTPAASIIKKLFKMAIDEAFANEPDNSRAVLDEVRKVYE